MYWTNIYSRKMGKTFLVFAIGVILQMTTCLQWNPEHSAVLDDGTYYMYWTYNKENITIEVQANTTGWVGFGLSPNGGMPGSDIVIGWVKDDGHVQFQDRYATSQSEPSVDTSQDWTLLEGRDNGTFTSIRFTRKLTSCDDHDAEITESTMRVIWAYGDETDPTSTTGLHKHTKRGVKSLQLQTLNPKIPILPTDSFTLDYASPNVTIPAKDTLYQCTGSAIPQYIDKHHVIKIEPLIQPGHEALVHHVLLYVCTHEVNVTKHHGSTYECHRQNMPPELAQCSSVSFGWAIGSYGYYAPDDVGWPWGEIGGPKFTVLEIHYDNPDGKFTGVRDTSGIRLTLTKTVRKYDAAILSVGEDVSPNHIIPPGAPSFSTVGHCRSECLSEAMGNEIKEIHVFGSLLHSHLLGRKLRLRHVRKGVELPMISYDENYDFNYQEQRHTKKITILPGDDLFMECITDSTKLTYVTYGGLSTKEEMCIDFLGYYPRINLTSCSSQSMPGDLVSVIQQDDIQLVNQNATTIYEDITGPSKYAGKSLKYYFDNGVNWKDSSNVEHLENLLRNSRQLGTCQMGKKIKYSVHRDIYYPPKITQPWVKPKDKCQQTTTVAGTTTPHTGATTSIHSCLLPFQLSVLIAYCLM